MNGSQDQLALHIIYDMARFCGLFFVGLDIFFHIQFNASDRVGCTQFLKLPDLAAVVVHELKLHLMQHQFIGNLEKWL